MVKTAKPRGYVNYGDINPREHGGMFVKDLGDSFRIVEAVNVADSCSQLAKERGKYLISSIEIDKSDLLADTGLNSFSGGDDNADMFDSPADAEADKLIRLASAVLSYRSGDDSEFTDNFYGGLRRFGVYDWK